MKSSVPSVQVCGMGEVYRARDTRLERTVAIKVLPPEFSSDPERRKRFEQEARLISSLNHPHICAMTRFVIIPPKRGADHLTLSPNGRSVAFISAAMNDKDSALWIRTFDSLDAKEVPCLLAHCCS